MEVKVELFSRCLNILICWEIERLYNFWILIHSGTGRALEPVNNVFTVLTSILFYPRSLAKDLVFSCILCWLTGVDQKIRLIKIDESLPSSLFEIVLIWAFKNVRNLFEVQYCLLRFVLENESELKS